MKKLLLQYFSALIFSVVGFFIFYSMNNILEKADIGINFGGDKGGIISGLFFGLSVGGIFGIVIIDKLIFKVERLNILSILVALILSIAINYFGTFILDKVGGWFLLFLPPLTALMCLVGYNIGSILD